MSKVAIRGKIKRQTEKAVLVEVTAEEVTSGDFVKREAIWLPKSQIAIADEEIILPLWLWRQKNIEVSSRTRAGRWEISAREAE